MVASVLNTPRAITVSVYVVRACVKLREMLGAHKGLAHKLEELEKRIQAHDQEITTLFQAMRQLMQPPEKPKKHIGFRGQLISARVYPLLAPALAAYQSSPYHSQTHP